ncbi:MAG: hypothetical protein ACYDBB_08680 [Armatimonadota bacterium]
MSKQDTTANTAVSELIKRFRNKVNQTRRDYADDLGLFAEKIMARRKRRYAVQQSVVFNERLLHLCHMQSGLHPRYLLVGDNPGRNEQLHSVYLYGRAGHEAHDIFATEFDVPVDAFDVVVPIINKTFVFSPRTHDLQVILTDPDLSHLRSLLLESQQFMAELTYRLHLAFRCPVVIAGYGHYDARSGQHTLKPYFDALYHCFIENGCSLESIYLMKHFSFGHFRKSLAPLHNLDLAAGMVVEERLRCVGLANRKLVLGW